MAWVELGQRCSVAQAAKAITLHPVIALVSVWLQG